MGRNVGCSSEEEDGGSSLSGGGGAPGTKYSRLMPDAQTAGPSGELDLGGPSDASVSEKERYARENHSEIERRRRNKMTHYISELADMVPQCAALGRYPPLVPRVEPLTALWLFEGSRTS